MEINTREFEGRFWQLTFAEILSVYRSTFPNTNADWGTITRAEMITRINRKESRTVDCLNCQSPIPYTQGT